MDLTIKQLFHSEIGGVILVKDYIKYGEKEYEVSTVYIENMCTFETMIFPTDNGNTSGEEVYMFRTFDAGESRRKHEDILTNMENYISEEAIERYFREKEEWLNT